MKAQTLIRSAVHEMTVPAHGVTSNSSAIIGVTLIGDLDDALAVLRTGTLLARDLRATLFVELPGKGAFPIHLDQGCSSIVLSGLLNSMKERLCKSAPASVTDFIVEVTITAASLVSEGIISMRIRTAHATSAKSRTR